MKMKHKKLTAVLVLVCFLLTLMPVAAMAATIDPTLPVPANVQWADLDGATVSYEMPVDWNQIDRIRVSNLTTQNGKGSGFNHENTVDKSTGISYQVVANMLSEPGDYRVEVFAATRDQVNGDSAFSSSLFSYPLTTNQLATPSGLTWIDGFAAWDPVPGAEGYTVGYRKVGESRLMCEVFLTNPDVYKANIPPATIRDGKVMDTRGNLQRSIDLMNAADYEFCVFAVSYHQKTVCNSKTVWGPDINSSAFTGQLRPVEGLSWTKDGNLEFYPVCMNNGSTYHVEFLKDGNLNGVGDMGTYSDERTGKCVIPFSNFINETGTYAVKINAKGDGKLTTDGPVTFSPAYNYTKPDASLGKPDNIHWDIDTGYPCWSPVNGANRYLVSYRVDGDEKASAGVAANHVMTDANGNQYCYCDIGGFQQDIPKIYAASNGTAKITFTVRAISDNILTVANSEMSDQSVAYMEGNSAQNVNKQLQAQLAALQNGSAPQPLNVDAKQLAAAMDTDAAVRYTLDQYEALYANKVGVAVQVDTSNVTAMGLDVSKVQIQGAALNATTGGTLKFSISDAEVKTLTYDNKTYTDNVQFLNLSLWRDDDKIGDGVENILAVPVRVTLPVPSGIAPDKLRILHYDNQGRSEEITPTLNDDKTMASFVLLHFSDFALVELQSGDNSDIIDDGGDTGNTDGKDKNKNKNNKDKKDKTDKDKNKKNKK